MEEWYTTVTQQLAGAIYADRVRIHRKISSAASDDFADLYSDWIYLDSNHLYEFVKQDLDVYYPKIKVEGFITGDNYGTEGWWENGVKRAVDEFVSQTPDLTPEAKGSHSVFHGS
jgi:hypothetical protein